MGQEPGSKSKSRGSARETRNSRLNVSENSKANVNPSNRLQNFEPSSPSTSMASPSLSMDNWYQFARFLVSSCGSDYPFVNHPTPLASFVVSNLTSSDWFCLLDVIDSREAWDEFMEAKEPKSQKGLAALHMRTMLLENDLEQIYPDWLVSSASLESVKKHKHEKTYHPFLDGLHLPHHSHTINTKGLPPLLDDQYFTLELDHVASKEAKLERLRSLCREKAMLLEDLEVNGEKSVKVETPSDTAAPSPQISHGELGDLSRPVERAIVTNALGFGRTFLLQSLKSAVSNDQLDDAFVVLSSIRPISRSRYYSETRPGQETLYEACDKVLEALRDYKEHSFPFLAKVNRRDVPDYYTIIKHPMDLGTMQRRLRNWGYNSKRQFKADLDLIWSNCFLYNADPNSIYRTHASRMRERAEELLRKVPEIELRPLTSAELARHQGGSHLAGAAAASVAAAQARQALHGPSKLGKEASDTEGDDDEEEEVKPAGPTGSRTWGGANAQKQEQEGARKQASKKSAKHRKKQERDSDEEDELDIDQPMEGTPEPEEELVFEVPEVVMDDVSMEDAPTPASIKPVPTPVPRRKVLSSGKPLTLIEQTQKELEELIQEHNALVEEVKNDRKMIEEELVHDPSLAAFHGSTLSRGEALLDVEEPFSERRALIRSFDGMGMYHDQALGYSQRNQRLIVDEPLQPPQLEPESEPTNSEFVESYVKQLVDFPVASPPLYSSLENPGPYPFFLPEVSFSNDTLPNLPKITRKVGGVEVDEAKLFAGEAVDPKSSPTVGEYKRATTEWAAEEEGSFAWYMEQNTIEMRKLLVLYTAILDGDVQPKRSYEPVKRYPSNKPLPPLVMTEDVARKLSVKAVSKLLGHEGFESAMGETVLLLSDLMAKYLENLAHVIRDCIDEYGSPGMEEIEKLRRENLAQFVPRESSLVLEKRKMSSDEILRHALVENGVQNISQLGNYVRQGVVRQYTKRVELRKRLEIEFARRKLLALREDRGDSGFDDEENDVWAEDDDAFVRGEIDPELNKEFLNLKELVGLDIQIPDEVWLRNAKSQSKLRNSIKNKEDEMQVDEVQDAPFYSLARPNQVDRFVAKDFDPIVDTKNMIGLLKSFYDRRLEESKRRDEKQLDPMMEDDQKPFPQLARHATAAQRNKLVNNQRLIRRRREPIVPTGPPGTYARALTQAQRKKVNGDVDSKRRK